MSETDVDVVLRNGLWVPEERPRVTPPSTHEERRIDVHLRDTVTGYSRVYETDGFWEDGQFIDFIWRDGNFRCDCNRALFLWDWDEDNDLPCDHGTPRIVIDKIVPRGEAGPILYAEDDSGQPITG